MTGGRPQERLKPLLQLAYSHSIINGSVKPLVIVADAMYLQNVHGRPCLRVSIDPSVCIGFRNRTR
jgi:hypothetical protein